MESLGWQCGCTNCKWCACASAMLRLSLKTIVHGSRWQSAINALHRNWRVWCGKISIPNSNPMCLLFFTSQRQSRRGSFTNLIFWKCYWQRLFSSKMRWYFVCCHFCTVFYSRSGLGATFWIEWAMAAEGVRSQMSGLRFFKRGS